MDSVMEQELCESGTGIRASSANGGPFYDCGGNRLSDTAARKAFRNGEAIEVPNAGAGSFREVLIRLGYQRVEVEDWTSSAGDWTLTVRSGTVTQDNRYPKYGFSYRLQRKA
jgi:hypothetical protein